MFQTNLSVPSTSGTRKRATTDILSSKDGITKYPSNVVLVTPTMAKQWLEHSKKINEERGRVNNRPESVYTIAKNARIMKRGEWRVNKGAPIALTKDGIIVNGHHRLKAIVEANIPVYMTVVYDAEEGDFDVIDTGKKRSLADIFALEGIVNAVSIASSVTRYIKLREGKVLRLRGNGGIEGSPDLYQDYLDEYYSCNNLAPDGDNLFQHAFRFAWNLAYSANSTRVLTATDIGAIYVFLIRKNGHSIESVEKFFTLIFHHGGDIGYLQSLSAQLIADKANLKKMPSLHKQSLIAKSWNMFVRGSHAHTVRVSYGEKVDFD